MRPDEFGMRHILLDYFAPFAYFGSGEYFAPNPVLSFFGMDFALEFGGED